MAYKAFKSSKGIKYRPTNKNAKKTILGVL